MILLSISVRALAKHIFLRAIALNLGSMGLSGITENKAYAAAYWKIGRMQATSIYFTLWQ